MSVFLLLALSIFFIQSNACGCVDIIGMKEAKIVFTGMVLSVKRIEKRYIRYEIKFSIGNVLKGKWKKRTIIVNTPCLPDACCGIPFEVNDQYEVFTYIRNKRLYTDNCTATKKLKDVHTGQKQ